MKILQSKQSFFRSPVLLHQTKSQERPSAIARAIKEREARRENVEGRFYVDHTCIDCDTCRWMQPEVYGRVGDQTAVVAQPEGDEQVLRAAQALLACPTHSIHIKNQNGEVKQAARSFPVAIPGTQNIYHLGYHSEASYGAASYLIIRESGNVMMDSPRFDKQLLKQIQEKGGAKYMVLSHKDDVCDHAKWAEELGLKRVIHKTEVTQSQGTTVCEHQLEGEGPWTLPNEDEAFQLIHTPGHTKGHIVMLYQNSDSPEENTCFTGDHLGFARQGGLTVFKQYCKQDLALQLSNLSMMADWEFLHLLPGHGRPGSFLNKDDRAQTLNHFLVSEGFSNV